MPEEDGSELRPTAVDGPRKTLRRRLHLQLDPRARPHSGLSVINRVLVAMILLASVLAIIETEPLVMRRWSGQLAYLEIGLGLLFAAEYLARLWTAPERGVGPAWKERLRFVVSPSGIADLVATASSFVMLGNSSVLFLRLIRLARILRLAKLGRMSLAMEHMIRAVASRRDELILSMMAGLVLMVLAATALYFAEGAAQPDKYGSIPRALWWSVVTLTTIGYGDVYPITPVGKVLAAITALVSIGLIAMPTGILAAAFSDAMEQRRRARAEHVLRMAADVEEEPPPPPTAGPEGQGDARPSGYD